jgi:hypothetical protein
VDISSTCKVGQKRWVSLPLLTCSSSAWPSRLLYRRGRQSQRDLWITLYIWVFFENLSRNLKVLLKSDKNIVYFTCRPMYTYGSISLNYSWNKKYFWNFCSENQNTHFFFNNIPPPPRKACRLWDNVKKYGRAGQVTDHDLILRMRFARWMTRATDTQSEYVMLIVSPLQQWLHERASALRYTYICWLSYWASRNVQVTWAIRQLWNY